MVKTKSKKSTCNYKFIYITIFCFLVCLDLILFALRKRHFNSFYPLIQQLLHTPGSDGTYAQNYQDTWFLRLAEVGLHLYPLTLTQLLITCTNFSFSYFNHLLYRHHLLYRLWIIPTPTRPSLRPTISFNSTTNGTPVTRKVSF